MTIPWDAKDPADVIPCTIDWTDKLNGSTIQGTPTWTIMGGPGSLTVSGQTNTTTQSQVIVSGGLRGRTYTLVCSIMAASGIGPLIQRATIRIKER